MEESVGSVRLFVMVTNHGSLIECTYSSPFWIVVLTQQGTAGEVTLMPMSCSLSPAHI